MIYIEEDGARFQMISRNEEEEMRKRSNSVHIPVRPQWRSRAANLNAGGANFIQRDRDEGNLRLIGTGRERGREGSGERHLKSLRSVSFTLSPHGDHGVAGLGFCLQRKLIEGIDKLAKNTTTAAAERQSGGGGDRSNRRQQQCSREGGHGC